MSSFLPADYQPPASNTNYLKFQKGKTKFRFLTPVILGYVWFEDAEDGKKKVYRQKFEDVKSKKVAIAADAKFFWTGVVLDYESGALKILEITQRTIQASIQSLAEDESWGSPLEFDLVVTRTGDGMETTYVTMPNPKTQIASELYEQAKKINLEALWIGDDPFANI